MYSFYGGRPGNSFIIITTYRSIADMVSKFSQGPNYTAVHYDEHVMINTVNKNDPDNGKIYRRGYDFTNDMGGAEFIGTIVGPAGKAPLLQMTTVADVRSKHAQEGYEERRSSGQYSVTGGNLIPGKTGTGTFNDSISWECCSIRNENNEDCTAYIGFIIPYTVIDYESSSVEPYSGGKYADTSSTSRVDDGKHPFFEKWHINVPKGVKGDALMNFKVETASTNVQDYTGRADDINNGRMILAYDYYKYDTYKNGAPVRLYLGDYNMIEDVSINEEGTLTVEYTHDDDSVFTKQLKWIDTVTLNNETGQFTVVYNHTTDVEGNPTTYTTNLDWINEVDIDDDGTITFNHTHEDPTIFDKKMKWCTGVTVNNNGTVTFTWNTGQQDTMFNNIIKWISSVNLASDGTLTVSYNNGDPDAVFSKVIKWITSIQIGDDGTVTVNYNNDSQPDVINQKIKWINDIQLTNSGTLTINYNDGNSTSFTDRIKWVDHSAINSQGDFTLYYNNGAPQTYQSLIKWIDNITLNDNGRITVDFNDGSTRNLRTAFRWPVSCYINTGETQGEGTQMLMVGWNDGISEGSGRPINYVMSMAVNNDNHLLVRYSDPLRREGGITYNNLTGWTDLGSIIQNYEYTAGTTTSSLNWVGIGQLIDDGVNNKKIKFFITPTALIDSVVNTIYINSGTLNGSNGVDSITNLNISTTGVTTITKTLTSLQFEVDSGIATSGQSSNSFINLSIENMILQFTVTNPQGG